MLENEQWETLFIDRKLYLLLIVPTQIKCTFRLVAINVQQLSTFTNPLLLGQETLQIKVKDFGRVRRSSVIFRVQVLRKYTASPGARERLRGPSARDDPESKCSGSTPSSLRVQVLGDDFEIKCSGTSPGTWITSPRSSELSPKCARVEGVSHDLTLITISLWRVGIYTTQTFLAYPM